MDFIHIYSYLYILTWQHSHTAQIVGRSPVEGLLTSCTHTGLQALYTCLQVLPSIGDYGEVIHIDRHNHLYSIFLIDPDTMITSDLFELQINQELVQQLIPRPVAL